MFSNIRPNCEKFKKITYFPQILPKCPSSSRNILNKFVLNTFLEEQGTSFKVMGNHIGSGLTNYSTQEIQGSEDFLYCHGFLIIVTHDILLFF